MSSLTWEIEMFYKSISVWQERACGGKNWGKNSEEIVRIRVHTTSLKFLLNQAFVHLCFVYAKYTSMDYYNIAEKTGFEKSSA
jgi:hypothetical protein